MKKILKNTLIIVGIAILAIQLVPVDRSNPEITSDFSGPQKVKEILKRSCYDCHSNETEWPWYSYVAPVSWLVSHDVIEGREELNFSDWKHFEKDADIIEEIYEETEEGEMPLPKYLFTHPGAKVSEEEMLILKDWARTTGHSEHHE